MAEKLIKLLASKPELLQGLNVNISKLFKLSDHLIANGVEIPVRCKDCKHWFEGNGEHTYGWCCQRNDISHVSYKDRTEPEDFCSKGERKADG